MCPFFSIIIPTYNSGETIIQTIESILIQSFENFEILIIDGLSSDDTLDKIRLFQHSSVRESVIKILSEPDKGVYDAMNKGIGLSSGEWIFFLGSDDIIFDERVLEDIHTFISIDSVDFLYGNVKLLSNKVICGEEFDIIKLHTNKNICHQAIFYKKIIFDKLGKYNLNYKVVADWEFNIRCFRHPDLIIKYIDRNISVYNDIDGLSSKAHADRFYDEIPLIYINKLSDVKIEIFNLRNSREYKIGKGIYKMLKFFGVIKITSRLKQIF